MRVVVVRLLPQVALGELGDGCAARLGEGLVGGLVEDFPWHLVDALHLRLLLLLGCKLALFLLLLFLLPFLVVGELLLQLSNLDGVLLLLQLCLFLAPGRLLLLAFLLGDGLLLFVLCINLLLHCLFRMLLGPELVK